MSLQKKKPQAKRYRTPGLMLVIISSILSSGGSLLIAWLKSLPTSPIGLQATMVIVFAVAFLFAFVGLHRCLRELRPPIYILFAYAAIGLPAIGLLLSLP